MKVGDIVRLVPEPRLDWMEEYLDKKFRILNFPSENGVELKMIGGVPEWIWIIGKDNVQIVAQSHEGG